MRFAHEVVHASARVAHDHRRARCERLVHDEAPGVERAREHEAVAGAIGAGHLALVEEAREGRRHAQRARLNFERDALRSVAGKEDLRAVAQARGRVEEHAGPLARLEFPREDQRPRVGGDAEAGSRPRPTVGAGPRGSLRREEPVVHEVRRRVDPRGVDAAREEVESRPVADRQRGFELRQQPSRALPPQETAQPGRSPLQIAVAAVDQRNAATPAVRHRAQLHARVPPHEHHHVRTGCVDGAADLGRVHAGKRAEVHVHLARRMQHLVRVTIGERHVPRERLAEPRALLRRRRRRRIDDGQVESCLVLGDPAEPGRDVLHRVRHHDGEPHGWHFVHRACHRAVSRGHHRPGAMASR